MKKTLLLLALLLPALSWGQEKDAKPKVSIHGFIRTDAVVDSRQNVYALEGLYSVFPKKPELDSNGQDLNDQASARELSLFSRLSFRITGPDVFNAKTSGLFEFDAIGSTGAAGTNNVLRFRHAYVKLDWQKSSLLVGRSWHPLFVTSTFPVVLNLNTGIPYQPFNRAPQIRFTQNLNKTLKAQITACYQSQYSSVGPDGKSPDYQRNAVAPNMNFLLKTESKNFKAGVAYDLLTLQPFNETTIDEKTYKNTDLLTSHRFMAYADLTSGDFEVKVKGMYGQNMSDQLLGGGYAITNINQNNGKVDYTQSCNANGFVEFFYKTSDRLKLALFGGYMKNFEYEDDIYQSGEDTKNNVFGKYTDVDYSYRIAPAVYYKVKNLQLAAEYEYTVAAYGDVDYSNKAKISNSEEVANNRVTLSLSYFF
ncbi:hypothetical protein K5X82_04435 [Halosquirtibacter xylanolyticus]|uniref:hypothetical protein n=1 Tax=Halosquirtibacter xylanolyticus TaxID=3374599 RepID=UPI003749D9F8|nr:hypothetical protein K5X82_04435 [Prolixibacteraceae bacterium]